MTNSEVVNMLMNSEYYSRGYKQGVSDTLNKIRAEISDFEEEVFHRPNTDYSDYAAIRHCLEIIDKYRESEDKE